MLCKHINYNSENWKACNEVMGNPEEAYTMYEESLKLRQVAYMIIIMIYHPTKLVFGERSIKASDSMLNLATVLDSQVMVYYLILKIKDCYI